MKDLIDYACTFDSDYRRRVVGASEEEIDRLEALVGRPLPERYRAYLVHMGRSDGLELLVDGRTAIADVIDHYVDIQEGREVAPEGCTVFGVGGLRLEEIALRDSDGLVVIGDGAGGIARRHAESLDKLLYRTAFALGHNPCRCLLTHDENVPMGERFATFAEGLGLGRLWFSDRWVGCYEGPDLRLSLCQFDEYRPTVVLRAQANAGLERVCGSLVSRLGLRRC